MKGITNEDLNYYIGRLGLLKIHARPIKVEVRVLRARTYYGRIDLLIEPTHGSGQCWAMPHVIEFYDSLEVHTSNSSEPPVPHTPIT